MQYSNCLHLIYFRSENIGWKLANVINQDTNIPPLASHSAQVPFTAKQPRNLGGLLVEQKLCQKNYVEHYGGKAGSILIKERVENSGFSLYGNANNVFAPFNSKIELLD